MGISIYTQHYEEARGLVLGTGDTDFVELWEKIIKGRSFVTGKGQFSISRCSSYLTSTEHKLLRGKICTYFGDGDAIINRFQSTVANCDGLLSMNKV
jgi:hypothetical protein